MVTPKGNSLHKNVSYDVQIVKVSRPVFCTAHPFTQPLISCALHCFWICQTPPKVLLPMEASTCPCNTYSLYLRDSAFRTASRLVQPFLHSSRQRVPVLYSVH